MRYSTDRLPELLGAKQARLGKAGHISQLLIDSRLLQLPAPSLFFAIPGAYRSGQDYIPELYAQGVRHFVLQQLPPPGDFPEGNFFEVEDVVGALQRLAAYHRRQFDLPVVAITGSNGKTIVKEWLFQLLHRDYRICRSPKSYNSQIGVPLSVWGLNELHELGLLEAGISRMGEMARLAPVVDGTIGVFTNIGSAHQEGFPSRRVKIEEKLQLFQAAEVVLYRRGADAEVDEAMAQLGRPSFCWSTSTGAPVQVKWDGAGQCRLQYKQAFWEGQLPFTDEASFENAMHCACLMLWLGYTPMEIGPRLLQLEPVGMRLERTAGINGCLLVNDSYNADLDGLAAALAPLKQVGPYRRKTAILSDILQSGLSEADLYQRVAHLLQHNQIERVVGIGASVHQLHSKLPGSVEQTYYPDTESFLAQLEPAEFSEEAILIKGARVFAFERIARRLSAKMHETVLEVDLSALLHNVRVYQRQLQPDTKLMVMVKAAAYGSGSIEVARALEFHQVDYLAVAYADEGLELRRGGISLPIMVLNPEEASFDAMLRYQLEPEIYSLRLLRQFGHFTKNAEAPVPIHLKFNTGMNRLGYEPEDMPELLRLLQKYPQLRLRSVFSHLAASGDPEQDDFTRAQVARYEAFCRQLFKQLPEPPLRHILNSSGITRWPQYQLDMVRLGIGAYGIDPNPERQQQLQTVLRLRARISQVRKLDAGETVGYGRVGRLPQAGRIATVSIGYADGLPRSVSNGRYALSIHGRRAPIIGSVCMDMCMVDITHIPEAQEGDEVLVFGDDPHVQELAEAMGTIPYEVFTSVSPRVSRIYVNE